MSPSTSIPLWSPMKWMFARYDSYKRRTPPFNHLSLFFFLLTETISSSLSSFYTEKQPRPPSPSPSPSPSRTTPPSCLTHITLRIHLFRCSSPSSLFISKFDSSMMKLTWFKQNLNNEKLERRLSLGEYKRSVSWSKYLVSSGGAIKANGGGEEEEESEWSADMSQLFVGNKFASGRHSRVYRGVYKQKDVAIKLVSQPEEDRELALMLEKQFTSEVVLLFRLQHPNIITLVAACKKPPVFCIITEYLAGGSLRAYLHQQEPYSVPPNLVLNLALDIARGMQYLHSEGILHRDLKSENLLLCENMRVKVADFGISCLESQCGSAKGFTGTYRWMAPEMIKEKKHTKKIDVYSFAIVLWELLTALTPFDDMTPEQAAFAVCQKNARPPLPDSCPMAFRQLISRCWSSKPEKRPGFDEIVRILERYAACVEENPDFLTTFEPDNGSLFGCDRGCFGPRKTAYGN